MPIFRKPDEDDLLRAAKSALRRGAIRDDQVHPSEDRWRQFVQGSTASAEVSALMAHLAACEQCGNRVKALRGNKNSRVYVLVVCAAALLVAAVIIVFTRPAPTVVSIDLRPYAPSRGPAPSSVSIATLPRKQLTLQITLPAGSPQGSYEVGLSSEKSQESTSSGQSSWLNGVATLTVALDARHFAPGDYQLRIRRTGQSWDNYAIRLE